MRSGMSDFRTHVGRAVEIKGSQQALAEAAGCSQQQISYLLNDARQISPEIALGIERATEHVVTRHDLRPDLFPREEGRAA